MQVFASVFLRFLSRFLVRSDPENTILAMTRLNNFEYSFWQSPIHAITEFYRLVVGPREGIEICGDHFNSVSS